MSKLLLFRLFIVMFLVMSFLVSHKMQSDAEIIILLFTCMMAGAYVVAEVTTGK